MAGVLIHSDGDSLVLPAHLTQMYRMRCKVFKERLKWDIACPDGMDKDRFDLLNPIYALCIGANRDVEGCWRLLPTTGPYMLRDVFPELLDGQTAPEQPNIWEISRFAVFPVDKGSASLGGVHSITHNLLVTLLELCQRVGIERVIAASDTRFEKILRRCGANISRIGPIKLIGKTPSVAGWIDVDQQNLDKIKAAGDHARGSKSVIVHQIWGSKSAGRPVSKPLVAA